MEKTMLSDRNIGRLLLKMSAPATIGMLVMSMYNVVDAIFIGRGVGTAGIAAVAIAFPIQMIVGAIGQMVGIGGASLLSRRLGAKDYETANLILGNVIAAISVMSLTITGLGYLYMDSLLQLFGATDSILFFAEQYLKYILAGVFMHSLAMALNNLVRAEGKPKIAMTTMLVSSVINVILDAIFILGLDMGIRGAAIATLIAYVASATFLVVYFLSGKSILKFHLSEIRFTKTIQREIYAIGVSAFIRQAAMSLLVILLNNTLGNYGGDLAIAVYGVVMRLVMLIFTPIMGIAQGFQPIAGYNFGAQDYQKTKESFWLAMVAATAISIVGTMMLMFFPELSMKIFSDDPRLITEGQGALRYMILAFPTVGFQVIGTTLFQAIGKATQTFVLTLARQFLFLIPLVIVMPRFFQINGIWMSFPIADILSFLLTLWLLIPVRNRYANRINLTENA